MGSKPKKTSVIKVESLSHDGRGISRIDGKVVFIDGALPGEEVLFKYVRRRASFDEGLTESIISPSPSRVAPLCPYFGICGGCVLQHLSHSAQLEHKQTVLLENLRHFGGIEPEMIIPPIKGPIWHYRRSARLGVRFVKKKGKALVGFREKRSSFICDIESCLILHETVDKIIPDLKTIITGMKAHDKIAQIEVSCGDNATGLVFRNLITLDESDIKALKEFAALHNLWIYLQPGGPETIYRIYPAGDSFLSYSLPEFELEFLFRPSDFIQVNAQVNRKMVKQAIEMLDPCFNDSVLDLFCGLGNFTLPIAQKAGFVQGVEASEDMISRAQENAKHNSIDNVRFFEFNLESETDKPPWKDMAFNKTLIDPPRSGAKNAVKFLKKTFPQRIVYISCNPATLARDAGELVKDGAYRLTYAGIMDMFPHTAHMEAMAAFDLV